MELKGKQGSLRQCNVSICMATYNGEKYIREQLNSILDQLVKGDEIIIFDDCSKDKTVSIINSYQDERIHLTVNQVHQGVNKNFENAIKLSKNEFVFMADQDDIWPEGRLDLMVTTLLESGVQLISGNTIPVNQEGELINSIDLGVLYSKDSHEYKKNIVRIFYGSAYYYGCAMAFHKDLKKLILPFPKYIESHDLWIAMVANLMKSNIHVEDIVLKRRIHGNNASVIKRSFIKKINARLIFFKSLMVAKNRISR